jgi:predicted SAM-dependent methyltransferase
MASSLTTFRSRLIRLPGGWRIDRSLGPLLCELRNLSRASSQRRLIADYYANSTQRKLHIGCGFNMLPGWLNSDFFPDSKSVIHLDATRRFPLSDESFDYVFSEHMIEHVPYSGGRNMLQECQRILRRNGRVRISTPNLKFLIDLYSTVKTQLQEDYIRWSFENHIDFGIPNDAMVINNYVRDWGHLFIYDEKTLRHSLEDAGFVDVVVFPIKESNDAVLRGLENDARMPSGFLQLESLTVEARKP